MRRPKQMAFTTWWSTSKKTQMQTTAKSLRVLLLISDFPRTESWIRRPECAKSTLNTKINMTQALKCNWTNFNPKIGRIHTTHKLLTSPFQALSPRHRHTISSDNKCRNQGDWFSSMLKRAQLATAANPPMDRSGLKIKLRPSKVKLLWSCRSKRNKRLRWWNTSASPPTQKVLNRKKLATRIVWTRMSERNNCVGKTC